MPLSYRRFAAPADTDALVGFLTGETWPFHSTPVLDADSVRRRCAEEGPTARDSRVFLVRDSGPADAAGKEGGSAELVGLIRLFDLADPAPMFDLRVGAAYRGRGVGKAALSWLTHWLFSGFHDIRRIEGTTRQDNVPMRRTFLSCGYVKESHYRESWPAADGNLHDAVGYAILRRDWESGTVTAVDWHDDTAAVRRPDEAPAAAPAGPTTPEDGPTPGP
ncbi:GNAT family N-acetyltransferase [Streptomyces sp. NPDC058657]|uniref:GNAT family N-acetyltransferase n=1 Tax=unclassified Streptomyces TaxID=2593676 RepID=UPI003654965C